MIRSKNKRDADRKPPGRFRGFLTRLVSTSEGISAIAAVLAVFVGIAAVCIAQLQIKTARDAQRETIAEDSFREYLKLAIEEPLFAAGTPTCSRAECKNPDKSYEWFVTYFLHSAEQIYLVYGDDLSWRRSLESHFCLHRSYLGSRGFMNDSKNHYNQEFVNLIAQTLQNCPAGAANSSPN